MPRHYDKYLDEMGYPRTTTIAAVISDLLDHCRAKGFAPSETLTVVVGELSTTIESLAQENKHLNIQLDSVRKQMAEERANQT